MCGKQMLPLSVRHNVDLHQAVFLPVPLAKQMQILIFMDMAMAWFLSNFTLRIAKVKLREHTTKNNNEGGLFLL